MVKKSCWGASKFSRSSPKLFHSALLVRSLLDPPEFLHYPNSNSPQTALKQRGYNKREIL